MNKLQQIYSILHKTYGPQGWWPLTPEGSHETKHHQGAPKHHQHRFEIIVGAILTQNTAWTNVEKAISNLNKNKSLSIQKIKKINQQKLGELIRSAGYYNQKSERLKIIADFFSKDGFRIFDKNIDDLRIGLLNIKGIGPETADSIILYAAEKPIFVIDAYTKRIFSRVGVCSHDVKYDELQNLFHKSLKKEKNTFKEYHALIVEHAKQHCRTKPVCGNCPLYSLCKRKF